MVSNFRTRLECPVCENTELSVIYEQSYCLSPVRGFIETHYRDQGTVDFGKFADANFTVVHCRVCDLLFQRDIPDDNLLGYIYNEMIRPDTLAKVERKLITLESVDKIAGEMATLFRMTGKEPADITLLDYGFGYGRWARVARGMGATVYATEIGEEKRQIAAALGVQILDDAAIDMMTFDIVHTEQVLEHLVEPGTDFARLAKAAKILFKAAVPARGNAAERLRKSGLPSVSPYHRVTNGGRSMPGDDAFVSIQPLEHVNSFSPATMRWLGDKNGMALVSRVRMGTVGVDVSSLSRFMKSTAKVMQMVAKATIKPDKGYYLFRRR